MKTERISVISQRKTVLDGGTISSENPTGYYYDTPTIQLAAAAKEGYTFKGWYTDSAFKNKITKIKKGTRKNYKLYAKWKINTYNIVFDGNGATSGSMKSISSCKYNTSYKLSANTFQRNGYKFIGWYQSGWQRYFLWRWCNSIKSFPYKWSNSKTICTVGSFVG